MILEHWFVRPTAPFTTWAIDFYFELYVMYTKSDAYPVLQNAVAQVSDLIYFAELIIFNLMNNVGES